MERRCERCELWAILVFKIIIIEVNKGMNSDISERVIIVNFRAAYYENLRYVLLYVVMSLQVHS